MHENRKSSKILKENNEYYLHLCSFYEYMIFLFYCNTFLSLILTQNLHYDKYENKSKI